VETNQFQTTHLKGRVWAGARTRMSPLVPCRTRALARTRSETLGRRIGSGEPTGRNRGVSRSVLRRRKRAARPDPIFGSGLPVGRRSLSLASESRPDSAAQPAGATRPQRRALATASLPRWGFLPWCSPRLHDRESKTTLTPGGRTTLQPAQTRPTAFVPFVRFRPGAPNWTVLEKSPKVDGHLVRLSARHAKLRRSGYRKHGAQ
jgi:hypothetical protein